MEHKINNDEFGKRILEKLEKKIAISEFQKQENIRKVNNYKKIVLLKVASFIMIVILITGNVYTYATYNQNMFSYLLNKIGIFNDYDEHHHDVNQIQNNDGNILTLNSYAVDKETLILNYRLKLKEKQKFHNEIFDQTKIITNSGTYDLDESKYNNIQMIEKISDTEYDIYKFYKIDGSKINENCKIYSKINIYSYIDEVTEDLMGTWEFYFDIEKNNKAINYEEYILENKTTNFIDVKTNKTQFLYDNLTESVILSQLKQSDIATKLVFLLKDYGTEEGLRYYVEILDENGNIILENNLEYLIGGVNSEVIFKKIDLDSKLKINIYETEIAENIIYRKATMEVDLSKELKAKEKESSKMIKENWKDIEFEYPEGSIVTKNSYDYFDNQFYTLDVELDKKIGNTTYLDGYIQIKSYKNINHLDLKNLAKTLKNLEYLGGYGMANHYDYTTFSDDKKRETYNVEMNFEQLMELAEKGTVKVNEEVVKIDEDGIHNIKYSDEQEIVINNIKAITWLQTYGGSVRKYIFIKGDNIYELSFPGDFEHKEMVEAIVNSIKTII